MTKTVNFTKRRTHLPDRNQWRWTLDADNHEPLAMSSESYNNAADAVHAFELTTGSIIEPTHQRVAVRVATVRVTSTATDDVNGRTVRVPVEVTTQITEALDVIGLSDDE